MLVFWSQLRSAGAKFALGCLLAASVVPAAQTSNRGMLVALGILTLYVGFRYVISGNTRAVFSVIGLAIVALVALSVGGSSNQSPSGRRSVIPRLGGVASMRLPSRRSWKSPVVGWATPSLDVTIGISLGTQGYAWMLMYSYGFVGLALFVLFLVRVMAVSWRIRVGNAYVMHGLLVTATASIWFYGLGTTQCLILVLVAGMLSRASLGSEAELAL